MTHEEIKGYLSAYFDAQLDVEKTIEISAHVAACAECRAALDGFKQLSAGAKENLSAAAPAAMKERLLKTEPAKKPLLRASTTLATAFVALIFVLVAGMYLKRYMPELWGKIQGKIGGAADSLSAGEGKR